MTAEDVLMQYPEKVFGIGRVLRAYLLASLPAIIEMPDPSANVIGYGYGPGYKATICTIIPSQKGIKLGFYKGSELPDPQQLLTGRGKVHRYVEIKSEEDIHKPALKALLEAALEAYRKRTG